VNIRFLTIAQKEVDDAYCWFEQRSKGSGMEYLSELHQVVHLIARFPLAGQEIEPEIRRCLFARFPYALIYGIDDQAIVVIAVAHTHREPQYWIEREW